MGRKREAGPRLDGVLVVSKPAGPTSHDVVALVRRLTGVHRVGHGGTLDPFALGVLPVFLGRATRMVEYHLADEKAYRASVVFGARSSTDDLDGEMMPGQAPPPTREALEALLPHFRGPIEQVPPDHSAVHVGGKRAYELARGGEKPELSPRHVTIHELEIAGWDPGDGARPCAVLELRCSAGTYVRSLARDMGELLGCGAYLGALTRTASGPFGLEMAKPLDEVREALATGRATEFLLPPDAGLEHIPQVHLPATDMAALARGQVIRMPASAAPTASSAPSEVAEGARVQAVVRVVDDTERLVAMARVEAGRLHPDKVFIDPAA